MRRFVCRQMEAQVGTLRFTTERDADGAVCLYIEHGAMLGGRLYLSPETVKALNQLIIESLGLE